MLFLSVQIYSHLPNVHLTNYTGSRFIQFQVYLIKENVDKNVKNKQVLVSFHLFGHIILLQSAIVTT